MPEYLHPGVYIEEIDGGSRPIEGVPTSTAAFLGEAERGPIRPRPVTSYREYQRWFGDVFGSERYLPYAARGFFENGGQRVVICRLVGSAAATAAAAFGGFTVRAAGPGSWGTRVFAKVEPSSSTNQQGEPVGFKLGLAYWGPGQQPFDCFTAAGRVQTPRPQLIEEFDDLVTDETSPDFYGRRLPYIDLNAGETQQGPDSSALAILVRAVGSPSDARPDHAGHPLAGGGGDATPLGVDDYVGAVVGPRQEAQGLAALERDAYRDVALLYAPAVASDVAAKIVDHCERTRSRFAVIDAPRGQSNPTALDPRATIAGSSYAAFYYPWIATADPVSGARTLVPPGGSVLGVYARIDVERGVFKAPANEVVHGALDLEYDITDAQQDELNPKGVNAIRSFPGRGIRVWGARTLTADAMWKYISVRRLFIFLERSIDEGTQWAVFEPNDQPLWVRVGEMVRQFLRAQWRRGALFGTTEKEAFFVTCDRTTMSQDDILNGRLICEIGIAPVRPAEFVVFRIFQKTAEAQQ